MRCPSVILLSLLPALVLSCSSAQQITTPPPISGIPPNTASADQSDSRFTLVLDIGGTPLPTEIQSVRFQVDAASLKKADGPWVSVPVEPAPLIIPQGANNRQVMLSTVISPGAYDSLALSLADVFVLFNENSGAPIGTLENRPFVLPLLLTATPKASDTLRLTLEPGPSLVHTSDCRWFFVPFVTTNHRSANP